MNFKPGDNVVCIRRKKWRCADTQVFVNGGPQHNQELVVEKVVYIDDIGYLTLMFSQWPRQCWDAAYFRHVVRNQKGMKVLEEIRRKTSERGTVDA